MDLATLLKPQSIKVVSDVTSKKRLMQTISDVAEGLVGLPAGRIFDALQDRESLGPTGVGHGVALPHARLTDLKEVCGAFLKLDKPIDFDSVDRQPVDLVFALFAPANTGVDHLKALALVSRTLRNPALCAKLRANSDPATLHTLITGDMATQAA
ncbi:PTS transporter subunit EIIA [Roseobacter sp. HKCCD9010]|jgi:PTS system nitrogen regulatory IIA component|uniref:PTS sugar transporter subunit IIA n=1 Tax=Rhodobacterales TaxID=204455 RepID=UPI001199F8C3|nr:MULTISPECIES: PTS sugar transporter subunit IIA [Rhodobacterales]MBF9048417.1 PTS transporter subunit EIIA [Rhodobacterales bacterium HKCCD4356]NNV10416.1 PTS transporter subunit EIIA [Roseobacter sp. HKCCD7357]NNV14601.1 PTS transporter subunit EIIA [Roseobacter sp. HKCCD8768]NNV24060.1 PTS transporter subunit EIIA [Roseobacter sp. HKCCD8192]NNV28317.1 PTS transporter subunit EIIA [Roseobacter sp. HKCCD9061]